MFEKNATFPVKKFLWPKFPCSIEHDKHEGTTYKGPKCLLRILCNFWVYFYRTWEVDENKIFWKKVTFPVKKRFRPIFSRIIEYEKPQATISKGSKSFLTITVEGFHYATPKIKVAQNFEIQKRFLTGCWKHNFLRKRRQTFHWKKLFDQFFSLLSIMRSLRGFFIVVHKVFWKSFYKKLIDHFFRT